MSAKTARLLFRPQSIVAILGTGVLSVVIVGIAFASFGATLPLVGELLSAAVGVIGGTKAVLAA